MSLDAIAVDFSNVQFASAQDKKICICILKKKFLQNMLYPFFIFCCLQHIYLWDAK